MGRKAVGILMLLGLFLILGSPGLASSFDRKPAGAVPACLPDRASDCHLWINIQMGTLTRYRLRDDGSINPTRKPTVRRVQSFKSAMEIVGNEVSPYRWFYDANTDYGDGNGKVGNFHIGASITLNGRQSNWKLNTYVNDGPRIKMEHHWNCVDTNGLAPNTSCSGGWRKHTSSYTRNTFHSSDSNLHDQDQFYYYDFEFTWNASGRAPTWYSGRLTSEDFRCKWLEHLDERICKFYWT